MIMVVDRTKNSGIMNTAIDRVSMLSSDSELLGTLINKARRNETT